MKKRTLKNPFDSLFLTEKDETNATQLLSKVTKLYEHKPFFKRWGMFNLVCSLASFLCQVISPLTAFVVFYFLLFDQTILFLGESISFGLSIIFSSLVCLGVELLKRHSTKNALIEYFNYKTLSLALGVAIICSVGSVATSFVGAYMLPLRLTSPPTPPSPHLVDLAKLERTQNQTTKLKLGAIESKEKEIQDFEKNNKSSSAPRLSRRANVQANYSKLKTQLHHLEGELAQIQKAHPQTLESTRIENQNQTTQTTNATQLLRTTHTEQMESRGLVLGYISLTVEFLFWGFMLFNYWYYKRSQIEFEQSPRLAQRVTPDPLPSVIPTPDPLPILDQPTQTNQPHQIGFFTESERLYNGCTTGKNGDIVYLEFEGKKYSILGLKNIYNANKSKVKKYKTEGKKDLENKYIQSTKKWAILLSILEGKINRLQTV